jgi:hypothetical protein
MEQKEYKHIKIYIIMENNKTLYLKTDDNIIVNEKCIKWVKKMSDCLEVCIKSTGCNVNNENTHKICKINNMDSYNKLNKHFE